MPDLPPDPNGWAVLTWNGPSAGWAIDWDGEFYTDLDEAKGQAGKCARAGYTTALVEVRPAEFDMPEPPGPEDEEDLRDHWGEFR